MTINEHVSDERLAHIRASYEARRKGYAFIGHPSYDESIAIIDELQQYRAAAEPVAWQWFHLNQWHVTNDEERARELAWDGVKVVPLYAYPRPSELLKLIERLSASGYEYNDSPVDETNAGAVVDIVLQQLADAVAQCDAAPQVKSVPDADYFASLVSKARVSADKAMRKFPQPNYVLNKVAEESGEVIKAVIHYTEGREEWANVEGEIVDNLAMLIRLVTEGDLVIGFTPPESCRAAMLNGGKS